MPDILLIGLNHKSAPVETREKFTINDADLESALIDLLKYEDIEEGFIICTCNRFEIYARTLDNQKALHQLEDFIASYFTISWAEHKSYFYVLQNMDAIKHLIEVASSLDSLVVGEPHISGQVKNSFFVAKNSGSIGPVWHPLFEKVLKIVKKVRTETGISDNPVSVSTVAVDLAKKIFGELEGKNILIIGAGEMSELAAIHMKEKGARTIYVTNRTAEKAEELARKLTAHTHPFSTFLDLLPSIDIVISSIAAPEYVITHDNIKPAVLHRNNNPLFVVDIGVPRNIDPRINELPDVYLYDIDDLKEVAEHNKKEREKEAELAELIINQEIHSIRKWFDSLKIYPTIRALYERIEAIRIAEIKEMNKKLGNLDPQQLEKINAMTKSLVKKLVNPLIEEIKLETQEKKDEEKISWVRKIFKIDEKL